MPYFYTGVKNGMAKRSEYHGLPKIVIAISYIYDFLSMSSRRVESMRYLPFWRLFDAFLDYLLASPKHHQRGKAVLRRATAGRR